MIDMVFTCFFFSKFYLTIWWGDEMLFMLMLMMMMAMGCRPCRESIRIRTGNAERELVRRLLIWNMKFIYINLTYSRHFGIIFPLVISCCDFFFALFNDIPTDDCCLKKLLYIHPYITYKLCKLKQQTLIKPHRKVDSTLSKLWIKYFVNIKMCS